MSSETYYEAALYYEGGNQYSLWYTMSMGTVAPATSDGNVLGAVSSDSFTYFGYTYSYIGSATFTVDNVTYHGFIGEDAYGSYLYTDAANTTYQAGSQIITLNPASTTDPSTQWNLTADAIACYALGTRIAIPSGEVPVEELRPGDLVLTVGSAALTPRPVRWVGRFTVDLRRHPDPMRIAPIRIRANAFAFGVPHRDLLLSPDHSVLIEDTLMQAQSLQNGATIAQEFPERITYLHVELDSHSVLLAEGLPAESYLDTDNRGVFGGERGARPLHPSSPTPDDIMRIWETRACAPLALSGPRVDAAQVRLRQRAQELGWTVTNDAALQIFADDTPLALSVGSDGRMGARLPGTTRTVRFVSRAFVPNWFDATADDQRRLGIALAALRLNGHVPRSGAFGRGWRAAEPHGRWTDGDASLAVTVPPDGATLSFAVVDAGGRYWLQPSGARDAEPMQSAADAA